MIDRHGDRAFDVFVVWVPVLKADDRQAAAAAAQIFDGVRTRQFWDGDLALARAMRKPLAILFSPVAWDVYCFYDHSARFGGEEPAPLDWVHQLHGAPRERYRGGRIEAALRETSDRVLATRR